jgi:hypothetical protein
MGKKKSGNRSCKTLQGFLCVKDTVVLKVFKDLGRCQSKTVAKTFDRISCDFERSSQKIFQDLTHVAPKKGFFLKDIERSASSLIMLQFLARSFKMSEDVVQKNLHLYMRTLLSSKDLDSSLCIRLAHHAAHVRGVCSLCRLWERLMWSLLRGVAIGLRRARWQNSRRHHEHSTWHFNLVHYLAFSPNLPTTFDHDRSHQVSRISLLSPQH